MQSKTHRRNLSQARKAQTGLSLVEMLISLAITLVLLGGALPMIDELRTGQALAATASVLETDLHYARSLAIGSGQPVRLSLQVLNNGHTCYAVHTGPANACRCDGKGQSQCESEARLLRLEEQVASHGVRVGPVSRSILFDGRKGTITPTATLQVVAPDGRAIHQVVNIMGRVRSCTPGGKVGGLRPCA